MDLGNIKKSISTTVVTMNITTGVLNVFVIVREINVDLNTMKLDDLWKTHKINIKKFPQDGFLRR